MKFCLALPPFVAVLLFASSSFAQPSTTEYRATNDPLIQEISFANPFAGGQEILDSTHRVVDGNQLVSAKPKVALRHATCLYQGQLCFEDTCVERYGVSPGPLRQEVKSAGAFYFRAIALPFTPCGWKAMLGH